MTRSFGNIQLDDNVNTFIDQGGLIFPVARNVTADLMVNRQGRQSWVKDDMQPLTFSLVGLFADKGGKYFRDFKAALLGQPRTTLTLGDGTRFEWVDCVDVVPKRVGGSGAGTSTPSEVWAYTAKCISYEPYARDVAPGLTSLGSCTTSNGTSATTFNVSYSGSAFSEPTWQFTLVIPAATTVTQVKLANAQTGETCIYTPSPALVTGTWYVLMDASGGVAGQTPSNNQYGVLAANTLGRGVTVYQSSAAQADYTGQIPTLIPGGSMTIPPTPYTNQMTATITGTGVLTSANLSVVAPNRWVR